ncbi:MAG: hypothetical protein Q8910_17170 [Bacteroidota bacterium]|nr:hypothetical protein [Bacteroidota bacterium]
MKRETIKYKMLENRYLKLLVLLITLTCGALNAQDKPKYWQIAPTPPLGWNSWDIYGTTVTEQQVKEQADAMAKYLLPSGYKY